MHESVEHYCLYGGDGGEYLVELRPSRHGGIGAGGEGGGKDLVSEPSRRWVVMMVVVIWRWCRSERGQRGGAVRCGGGGWF